MLNACRPIALLAALLYCVGLVQDAQAQAPTKVVAGTVGSASANVWPLLIAIDKGFFDERGIKLDLIYIQSSAQVAQQLAAGSLDFVATTGLADPIRAIEKGAAIALVSIDVQSPPYALVGKTSIKSIKELAGKTISIGGPKDITRIFVERMLAPNGIKPGEFDTVYAGATSARAQALLSGAVDAAILLPPFNFQLVSAGYSDLGSTVEYAPELPFSGSSVNTAWAKANPEALERTLAALAKAVVWFQDSKNRGDAVAILAKTSKQKPEEVEKAYDFFNKGKFFEGAGKVSRKRLTALVSVLVSLGDIGSIGIDRLVLPGDARLVD